MNRKPTRQSRGANAAEKRHMDWLAHRMICAACRRSGPVILHHAEGSCFKINKVILGHKFVLSLCQSCDDIVTKESRKAFRECFGSQSGLWQEQFEDYPNKHEFSEEEINAIISYGK